MRRPGIAIVGNLYFIRLLESELMLAQAKVSGNFRTANPVTIERIQIQNHALAGNDQRLWLYRICFGLFLLPVHLHICLTENFWRSHV